MLPTCACGFIIQNFGLPVILNQGQSARNSGGRLLGVILAVLIYDLRSQAPLSTSFEKHLVSRSLMCKISVLKKKRKEKKFGSISAWRKP